MSKVYNIIEAINMPVGTEFTAVTPKGHKYSVKVKENQDSKILDGLSVVINDFVANTKFYKIQQPVDFIEAVKAYSKGKKIRCSLNSKTDVYFKAKSYEGGFNLLVDEYGDGIDDTEILGGEWYIEEDD